MKHAQSQGSLRAQEAVFAGSGPAPALVVSQLEKIFGGKDAVTKALNGISMQVAQGEMVAIMGPSGSGKSTLLNCIATIERPTSGQIVVGGQDLSRLRGRDLARFRGRQLGFIFQDSNLLDTLTGYENIALSLTIQGARPSSIDGMVRKVACDLGVEDVLGKLPGQMSGGQRQRVAAARAMVGSPALILADEPTGALDSRNATVMLRTLERMNREMGATIVMVTHDAYAASFAQRVIFIKDGAVFTQVVGQGERKELFDRIMEVQSFLSGEVRDDA